MDTTLYEFDPLEPGDPRSVGGYPLRARIGAGGMGRVYLSFTPGGRPVAVKLIRGELASDPEFRERFAREVSIAQQVNGIHIAQLIDSGSDRGVPWLASAYVAGPSLSQVVSACGPLPPATVLALAGRIAESLAAIHATGMVHRDLKPGNILIDESGPKVIDFGIVRAATPTATGRSSHRTFIGSPPFMAPEQIRGRKVTPATDVFALGATVYYLATGESAFQADFADGVLYRVMHDEPDYETCPEQVRELIRACLRKEPEERPSTQRIIEGCRAAGAGPETPLPDAVLAMIQGRAQALKVLATKPAPALPPQVPSPVVDETEQETETDSAHAVPVPTPVPALGSTPAPAASGLSATADPHAVPTETALSSIPTVPEQHPAAAGWIPAPDLLPPTVPVTSGASAADTEAIPPPGKRRGRTLKVAAGSSLATAIVAIAVAALVWPSGTASSNNVNPPIHTGSTAPATNTTSVTTSTSSATSDSASATTAVSATNAGTLESGGSPVQWQGQVVITVSGTDLDSVPVNNGANSQVSSLYDSTGFGSTFTLSSLATSGNLAAWTSSNTPTRSECYNQVSSQGVSEVQVTDGMLICVLTAGDRVALIKVLDNQANNANDILTYVTVWTQVAGSTTSAAAD